MTFVRLYPNWSVHAGLQIAIPLDAQDMWKKMLQFERFTTIDAFHRRVELKGAKRPGTKLKIVHGLGFFRLTRIGRILSWREDVGYSFSDMSRRGNKVGFPHIYAYDVKPVQPGVCILNVDVKGKWTARMLPRSIVKLWLRFVLTLNKAALSVWAWRTLSSSNPVKMAPLGCKR